MTAARSACALVCSLLALAGGVMTVGPGCSLGNVAQDDCTDDAACVAAFGIGSACEDGFCTAAVRCETNADCRAAIGAALVCGDGQCGAATLDERCRVSEPPELLEQLQSGAGPGDRLLIGAIFEPESNQGARTAAVQLAVREMNAAGGIRGAPLGLLVCDPTGSEGDPSIVKQLVLHLGDEIGAPVVIGPAATADVIVAINAVLAAGVPVAVLSPSATGVQLSGQADRLDPADELGLLWRTAPSDVLQAAVLADIVAEELAAAEPAPTVAVIYQDDPYGQSLESTLRDALEQDVPDAVVKAEKFDIADLDASAADAAARAASEAPDVVVVLTGRADRALAVLQAATGEAALADLPFFLSDGAKDSSILFEGGDAGVDAILQGALGTAPFNPIDGSFFDALESDFGVDASQFGFVAHAYDAAYVAALGLAYAARPDGRYDGRGVVEGFARLSSGAAVEVGPSQFSNGVAVLSEAEGIIDVAGESGPLDFDDDKGEAPGPIEVWRVNAAGDGFEQERRVDP